MEFFIDLTLPEALRPWKDSASKQKWVQEWGGKDGRCVGLKTETPGTISLEIWKSQTPETITACPVLYRGCFGSLKHLKPSGPVQSYTGVVLEVSNTW